MLCALTLGVWGAVWHLAINRELRDFGAARGRMPFAFITVDPTWSLLAYLCGGLGWLATLATTVDSLVTGDITSIDDAMVLASSAFLAAPLWITARTTVRRVRTAQVLAGIDRRHPDVLLACLASLVFPVYAWYVQRALNRVWGCYAPRIEVLSSDAFALETQPLRAGADADADASSDPAADDTVGTNIEIDASTDADLGQRHRGTSTAEAPR